MSGFHPYHDGSRLRLISEWANRDATLKRPPTASASSGGPIRTFAASGVLRASTTEPRAPTPLTGAPVESLPSTTKTPQVKSEFSAPSAPTLFLPMSITSNTFSNGHIGSGGISSIKSEVSPGQSNPLPFAFEDYRDPSSSQSKARPLGPPGRSPLVRTQSVGFGSVNNSTDPVTQAPTAHQSTALVKDSSDSAGDNRQIHLLRGDSVKVLVGPETPPSFWHLPKALLSHHSAFFKKTCEIKSFMYLPIDDASVFEYFVEFLYHGTYTLSSAPETSGRQHAAAWVLGEKYQAISFQNCAMRNIYYLHEGIFANELIPSEVQFVFQNSSSGSLLREFYLDMLGTHFTGPNRSKTSSQEWDRVMQDHAEVRVRILSLLVHDDATPKVVKLFKEYML